ncbi:MAG: head-tail connector protein [Pseudomonadota bacterium]
MVAANDLAILQDVKDWVGATNSTDDALLARLITAASTLVQNYINRDIYSKTYTEKYSGSGVGLGATRLVPQNYPITAVSSLVIDTQSIPVAANAISSGYQFDDISVMLNGYYFTKGLNNIIITYTAGFAVIPFDIAQAVIELVGYKYRERTRIGENSKNLAGQVTSFNLADLPATVKTTLNQYKRYTIQ